MARDDPQSILAKRNKEKRIKTMPSPSRGFQLATDLWQDPEKNLVAQYETRQFPRVSSTLSKYNIVYSFPSLLHGFHNLRNLKNIPNGRF
jgi:hypothetical protein